MKKYTRLEHQRRARGLSLAALGRLVEIDPTTLGRYENGRRSIGPRDRIKLEAFFGLSAEELTKTASA